MNTLFELRDYKAWLNQHIRYLPGGGRGELSRIAAYLGIHVSLVSQILRGEKDFTIEQAHALTEYFGFNELQTEFFVILIQMNRAGTHKLKKFYNKRRDQLIEASRELKNRLPIDRQLTDDETARFYSSWIYSAVRVFTSFADGKSAQEIQSHFQLTKTETHEILDFLVYVGLCEKNLTLYRVGPQRTHLPFGSPFLQLHLANWRIKSLEAATHRTTDELMYSACLSLSEADFQFFREQLTELIKAIQNRVKDTSPEKIVIFNLDWCFLRP